MKPWSYLLVLVLLFLYSTAFAQVDMRLSKTDLSDIKYKILCKFEKKVNELNVTSSVDLYEKFPGKKQEYLRFILRELYPEKKLPLTKENLKKEIQSLNLDDLKSKVALKKDDLAGKVNDAKGEEITDFFNSGFIEYATDGSTKGAVRVLKLRIGEPSYLDMKRLSVPLYVFVSANGSDLLLKEKDEKNKGTLSDMLNPIGGITTLYVGDNISLAESKFSLSSINLSYQFGGKVTKGEDLENQEKDYIINSFGSIGILLTTGVWNVMDEKNMGRFWLQGRFSFATLTKNQVAQYFNNNITTLVAGLYFELGLLLTNKVNLKLSCMKPLVSVTNEEYEYLKKGVVRFTFDFSGT